MNAQTFKPPQNQVAGKNIFRTMVEPVSPAVGHLAKGEGETGRGEGNYETK